MKVLYGTHPEFLEHETGVHHPESSERLVVVSQAVDDPRFENEVIRFSPTLAPTRTLVAVHSARHLETLRHFCLMGGGEIDGDTTASPQSFEAARRAAGAGIDAIQRLQRGDADSAFLAVRPPGHHASQDTAMGFCLLNNIAISAKELTSMGQRVVIVDFDAHHGNGTQDIFYRDKQVMYVSTHQYPFFPGTGSIGEVGEGEGWGTTINIPLPPHTNGATTLLALNEIASARIAEFRPDWLLISAGFDAHRDDPLTDLNFQSGDYYLLTQWALKFVPPGRTIAFLEGGYDLTALKSSVTAMMAALTEGEAVLPPNLDRPDTDLVITLERLGKERKNKAHE